jgi:hypothetical protein
MATHVSMTSLLRGSRLADGDRIKAVREPGDAPDEYAFTLELGPGITWWKGLIAVNDDGEQTQVAEVQDGNNSADLLLTQEDIDDGATLELWKGKAFNVHTHMYTLTDLSKAKGKHVTLTWKQD